DRQGENNALTNLGNIYYTLEKYELAQKYQEESLTIAQELHQDHILARSLSNLKLTYQAINDFVQLTECRQQLIAIARDIYATKQAENFIKILENLNINPLKDLPGADLSNINLDYANLAGANFNQANLTNVDFNLADLSRANFTNANLSRANLINANLRLACLHSANLTYADLRTKLPKADLTNAQLTDAFLQGAYLPYANLTDADLTNANLENADLTGVNCSGAKFIGTNLKRAEIKEIIVENTHFINTFGISPTVKTELVSKGAIFSDNN
ncbi:MAG: pentapeptide repeat-containing protein, partial [Microcoleaceae cyanobacterium]